MSLFAHRSFTFYWLVRVTGTAGNQMMMVAVAWQMYALTGSAWDLGLVGLFEFLPALPLVLVTGSVVDRYDRRLVLGCCLVLQGLVSLVLVGSIMGHVETRGLLLGLAIALGVARAFQMPAQQALVAMLVPAQLLTRAISLGSAGNQGAIIVGPAIAGALYAGGPVAVFSACTVVFALACMLLTRVRYERTAPQRDKVTLDTLLAGARFIWNRPAILGAISLDLFAVLLGGATALLPIYAKDILHTGPWGLGLLRSSPAVGAVAMSVLLARFPIRRKAGITMFSAVAIYGLMLLAFALSTHFLLSMVLLTVAGAADMVSVVIRQSLVQLDTPDAMRGRVSAVNSVFIGASNQLGEFESGATAAWFGPVASVLIGGAGTLLVAALWFKLFPSLARREGLGAPEPEVETSTSEQARSSAT